MGRMFRRIIYPLNSIEDDKKDREAGHFNALATFFSKKK